MGEYEILKALKANFYHDYVLCNSYVFGWESDYFGIAKQSQYIYEIEVKISVSDFRSDFNKKEKHYCLKNADKDSFYIPQPEATEKYINGYEDVRGFRTPIRKTRGKGYCRLVFVNNVIPNRFFYAVPEDIAEKVKEQLPKYAGLLVVNKNGSVNQVRTAKLLHKRKLFQKLTPILLRKFYYKSIEQSVSLARSEFDRQLLDCYVKYDFDGNVSQLDLNL